MEAEDPVGGRWFVSEAGEWKIWCDASSLALGVCLAVNGAVVEDAAWLRKATDASHINVSELDAVLKGVNLALKWQLCKFEIMTDSATVCSWVRSVITGDSRIKTKGSAEMLIRRRLSDLRDLISQFGLSVKVSLVKSAQNRADVLTRVKKSWLEAVKQCGEVACAAAVDVAGLHSKHHFGVDRTLYLARLVDPSVARRDVKKCVQSCQRCRSIDPAPARHEAGSLSVNENWSRLAVDVTHYRGKAYLTMVDCGPSRFAVWRQLSSERAVEVVRVLEEIFRERGPVVELLMDNGASFRSQLLVDLCKRWNVQRYYRAAYRPSGNGIAERLHRTIKRTAERSGCSVMEAVFWYNMAPKKGTDSQTVPSSMLHTYVWRHPMLPNEVKASDGGDWCIGDRVWVKPENARCTSQWRIGRITRVISVNNVEVDGIPRHVLDIRSVRRFEDERGGDGEDERGGDDEDEPGDEDGDERGDDDEDARGGDGEDERVENDEEERGEADALTRGRESVSIGRHQRQRRLPKWLDGYLTY